MSRKIALWCVTLCLPAIFLLAAVGVNPQDIKSGVARDLVRLAARAQAPLIVLDPEDAYAEFDEAFAGAEGPRIVRVGRVEWTRHVEAPAAALPAD